MKRRDIFTKLFCTCKNDIEQTFYEETVYRVRLVYLVQLFNTLWTLRSGLHKLNVLKLIPTE